MTIRGGYMVMEYPDWKRHILHYRGIVDPSGAVSLRHTNNDGSVAILTGQISNGQVTGRGAFQTINRFVVHLNREKMRSYFRCGPKQVCLRKDCIGLAVKKVLYRRQIIADFWPSCGSPDPLDWMQISDLWIFRVSPRNI